MPYRFLQDYLEILHDQAGIHPMNQIHGTLKPLILTRLPMIELGFILWILCQNHGTLKPLILTRLPRDLAWSSWDSSYEFYAKSMVPLSHWFLPRDLAWSSWDSSYEFYAKSVVPLSHWFSQEYLEILHDQVRIHPMNSMPNPWYPYPHTHWFRQDHQEILQDQAGIDPVILSNPWATDSHKICMIELGFIPWILYHSACY